MFITIKYEIIYTPMYFQAVQVPIYLLAPFALMKELTARRRFELETARFKIQRSTCLLHPFNF